MNFKNDKWIDPSALDVEILRQPELIYKYGKAHSLAIDAEDRASLEVELVEGEINDEINEDIETRLKGGKDTINSRRGYIITQKSWKVANAKLMEAKMKTRNAKAAMNSIEAKRSALENLVRLAGMSYFSTPDAPRDLAREAKRREADSSKAIEAGAKMTRRKKNDQ